MNEVNFDDILKEMGFENQTTEQVIETLLDSKDGIDTLLAYVEKYNDDILDIDDELDALEKEYGERMDAIEEEAKEENRKRIDYVKQYNDLNRQISGFDNGIVIENSISKESRIIDQELLEIYKKERLLKGNLSNRLTKRKEALEQRKRELDLDKEDLLEERRQKYNQYQETINNIEKINTRRKEIINELNKKEQELRNTQSEKLDIVDKYELLKQEILKKLVSKKFSADSEFEEIKRIHEESLRNNEVAYAFSLSEEYLNKMNKKIDIDKKINYILGMFNLSEDEIGLNNSIEESKENENESIDSKEENLENPFIISPPEQDLSNDSILSEQTEEELDDKQVQFEDTGVLSREELENILNGKSNNGSVDLSENVLVDEKIPQPEDEQVSSLYEISDQIPKLEKQPDDPQINFQDIIPKDVGKDVVERFIEEHSKSDSEENSQSEELENENELENQATVLPNSENETMSFETPKSQEEYWNMMYPKKDVEPYKKEFGKKMTLSELAKEVEQNGPIFKDEERIDENYKDLGYQTAKNLGHTNEEKIEKEKEEKHKKEKKGLLSLFNKKHKKKEEQPQNLKNLTSIEGDLYFGEDNLKGLTSIEGDLYFGEDNLKGLTSIEGDVNFGKYDKKFKNSAVINEMNEKSFAPQENEIKQPTEKLINEEEQINIPEQPQSYSDNKDVFEDNVLINTLEENLSDDTTINNTMLQENSNINFSSTNDATIYDKKNNVNSEYIEIDEFNPFNSQKTR